MKLFQKIIAVREISVLRAAWVLRSLLVLGLCATVGLSNSDQTNHRITQGSVSDNATVSLNIPLMSYPGRGLDLPVTINYSSNVWRLEHLKSVKYYQPGFAGYAKQSIVYPIYSEHATAGWTSSLNLPIIEWPKPSDTYDYKGKPNESWAFRIAKVTIRMPDGSSHELRKSDTPYPGAIDTSGTFYAVDGSRMRYDSVDADTGTLYMPNGTRYVLDGGTCEIIDVHGNEMSFDLWQWTDTLGRQVMNPIPTNPQAQDYTYYLPGLAGVNGGAQAYTFKWKHLANALTPESGGTPSLRVIASHYLPTPSLPPSDSNQGNYPQDQTGTYSSLFYTAMPTMEEEPENPVPTMVIGNGHSQGQLFNPVVLAEVVLPDGTSYKFGYNVYGEISKVTYPTGAYDRYTHNSTITYADGYRQPYSQAERSITLREQSIDGTGSDARQWTYSEEQSDQTVKTISITAPDTTKTEVYTYSPWVTSDANTVFAPFGLGDSRIGSTVERRSYSSLATGRTLLRRELTSYEQSSNTWVWTPPPGYPQVPKTLDARRNPRPQRTTSLIFEGPGSALAQSTTFQYNTTNQFNTGVDQTQASAYHFAVVDNSTAQAGTIGDISLGTFAKRTDTAYHTLQFYRDSNILGLPTVVAIVDGSGTNVVSRSEMVYDECPAYCVSAGKALPTSMKTWDSSKGTDPAHAANQLVTHAKFDQWGNRTEATDAEGFVTTTVFDSTYQAFPVSVTSPIPDPNSTGHGSNAAFTSTTTYDTPQANKPPLGFVAATTDANGVETRVQYNDDLLRPTRVAAYYGGQQVGSATETSYGEGTDEATRWVKVRTQIDSEKWSEAISKYDGLGRTTLTKKIDSQGNIGTKTEYDLMGRVLRSSNPYRLDTSDNPAQGETLQWTTPEYDDLSRTKKVTSPDTATVGFTFSLSTTGVIGVTKTATDQAGKKRRGITDALGRMVRVTEDPDGQPLITDYVFDTLGNLRKTIQGEQNRYFLYNSTGRLIKAKQIEQNANPAISGSGFADPLTGNHQWSVSYAYDDNGNILTSTDARNISITATYDQLNRLKTRDYSDPNTPDVSFFYDGKYLDAADVPQMATGSVKGKATGVKSSVSRSNNVAFDQMGRLTASQQITDGQTYSFGYTYNLSGALIEESFPSGRVVKNTLNADGELAQVQSRKNSNHGFFTYADSFTYNSAGAATKMQLGNGRWETAHFNDRLQVTKLGLGATHETEDLLKLEFGYGTSTENNGSMRSQTMTVPTVGVNQGFVATQSYVYDSLNRIRSVAETISGAPTWKQTFEIDRYGNREFDAANTTTLGTCQQQICNPDIRTSDNRFSDGQGYVYDSSGNVTHDASGQRYGYDASNKQMSFFASTNGGSTPDATYHYDGDGRRVKKVVGSEVTIFVYDSSGELAAEYSTTVQPVATAKVSYLTTDHLGSPRIVTDQNGAVTSRKDFSAYGDEALTSHRTPGLGYIPSEVRQDYTGYESDDESGLEFAQNRYYSTGHGRFTSVDPLTPSATIKNPQTFNRYSYVTNSPYKFTDPLGLMQADASQGWSSVGPGFWGTDLNSGRFSSGQQAISAAAALNDAWTARYFQNARDANQANSFIRQGNIQAAQKIVDANKNLEMVEARQARYETSVREVDEAEAAAQPRIEGPFVVPASKLAVYGSENDAKFKEVDAYGNGDCPILPQNLVPNLGQVRNFIQGRALYEGSQADRAGPPLGHGYTKNDPIARGTVIFTPNDNGFYDGKSSGNHVAIFLSFGRRNGAEGIYVVDQYLGRKTDGRQTSGIRFISARDGGNPSNNARAFAVVLAIRPLRK